MENLLNYKGRRFQAKIYGIPVAGRIQVEGDRVFLCQNTMNGADAHDKLGYRYSWCVGKGIVSEIARADVTDFRLPPTTREEAETFKDWQAGDRVIYSRCSTNVFEVIFRSGEFVVLKNMRGRLHAMYTCDELYNYGFRLVPPEQDAPEEEKPAVR